MSAPRGGSWRPFRNLTRPEFAAAPTIAAPRTTCTARRRSTGSVDRHVVVRRRRRAPSNEARGADTLALQQSYERHLSPSRHSRDGAFHCAQCRVALGRRRARSSHALVTGFGTEVASCTVRALVARHSYGGYNHETPHSRAGAARGTRGAVF